MLLALALAAGCRQAPEETDPGVATDPGVTLGPVQACEAPLAEPSWREVAFERGIAPSPNPGAAHQLGGSVVADDLDGDGDVDLAIAFYGSVVIHEREGDLWTGIPHPIDADAVILGVATDPDGQRRLWAGGHRLRWVAPDGRTEDVLPGEYPLTASLHDADIDLDGVNEAFALVHAVEWSDYLLVPGADGWERTDPGLDPEARAGFDAVWFDHGDDADLDLFVVNDRGEERGPDALFENRGGELADASEGCGCAIAHAGMGADVADFDGDGLADLFVAATARNDLLQQQPDGTFVDVAQAWGLRPFQEAWRMSWGAIGADLDNDGGPDLVLAHGDRWDSPDGPDVVEERPTQVFANRGGAFEDVTAAWGLEAWGSWRAAVAWDDNGDGVLDLLVTDVVGRPAFWLSEGCSASGWLEVAAPIGSRVQATVGERTFTTWVSSRSGFAGTRPPVAHLGVGEADRVDLLEIRLPDGTVRSAAAFEPRRRVVLAP